MLSVEVVDSLWKVKYLGALVSLGLFLSWSDYNNTVKQIGTAIAFMSGGAAAAVILQDDLQEEAIQEEIENNTQEEAYRFELELMQTKHRQEEASLKQLLARSQAEYDVLKRQLAQVHEVMAEDQSEKGAIFRELEVLTQEHQHVLHELHISVTAPTTSTYQPTYTRTVQTELQQVKEQSQERIAQLEKALADKSALAAQMLTELEAEATNTFNQFNDKVNAQSELIRNLYEQLEQLQRENAALSKEKLSSKMNSFSAEENSSAYLFL